MPVIGSISLVILLNEMNSRVAAACKFLPFHVFRLTLYSHPHSLNFTLDRHQFPNSSITDLG